MSRSLNKVMLIGYLGREPEMRYTPSGRPVTTFSIGTNRTWKSADGKPQTETEWFNVVTWGNLAEICKQHLVKGQQVYIEGRLQNHTWEDSAGNQHSSIEIVANEMIILGSRKENLSPDDRHARDEPPFPNDDMEQ